MCGLVRHRDAETTGNKLLTDKSHLQIVAQNRMNGSVRDASVLFQLHYGQCSIILNQLSHFFNQRNYGNVLTVVRIRDVAVAVWICTSELTQPSFFAHRTASLCNSHSHKNNTQDLASAEYL
jgi:hypothetical protein